MKVRLILCSTHVLKNVIIDSKQIDCLPHVRKTFIYTFSLIQNSIDLLQLENYLLCIYCLFNSKKLNKQVIYSLKTLWEELKKRNISSTDINLDQTRSKNQRERDTLFNSLNERKIFVSNDNYDLTNDSPFKLFFDKKFKEYSTVIDKESDLKNNEYYCPELFHIINKRMHLVPLWSGIMIPSNLNKTRLVNNFVENHFGQTKHNLIPRLKISISEFVGLSYKKLIFFSYLFFDSNFEDSNLEQKNISNDLNFEKWKDKNEKIRREKGIYYENKDILKFKTLNNYDFINSLEKNDFETFDVMDGIEENNQDKKIDSKIDFLKKYLKLNGNEYQIEAYLEFEFMISIQNQKYDNIKSIFLNHQILFENLLSQIRSKKISLKFVNQKTADLFITKLSLPNGMFPILVDGDGNCLYNSISMICFNTQRHFRIIKALSMYVMIKNREKFEQISILKRF